MKNLIKLLYFFGVGSFIFFIKKPLAKDWLLVFFIKSYYAALVDQLVVNKGYIQYPTRFPKKVKTSVLFDYILFIRFLFPFYWSDFQCLLLDVFSILNMIILRWKFLITIKVKRRRHSFCMFNHIFLVEHFSKEIRLSHHPLPLK